MGGSEDILAAARAIRPYLPELLAEHAAARADARLAELLERGDEAGIVDEFEGDENVRDWAAGFLEHGMPPDIAAREERSFQLAPGYGDAVRIPEFACPRGDYTWYRHAVGQTPPKCPTHQLVVEPVDR